MANDTEPKPGSLGALWRALWRPTVKYSLGALLIVGFAAGIIFWGGFHTAMDMSNNEQFCIGCHEMRDNVYQEYKETIHYRNRTGVRATCPDCHVPKEWVYKVIRKIKASTELYHKLMGTVDTREKFQEARLVMAKRVWDEMKRTNSRECRNCHSFEFMDFNVQKRRPQQRHPKAMKEGKTCIDCHKGIAHDLPKGIEDTEPE